MADDNKQKKRETWQSPAEFILAVVGYSVGMGSLTRFPFMVMKNGGGAFLIPFILAMLFVGMPLFYLEVLLGQFSAKSPLTLWAVVPAFKGVGYSMTLLTFIATIYYMPFTWSIVYLFASFTGGTQVPWGTCDNWWNTDRCQINWPSNGTTSSNISAQPFNNTLRQTASSPAEEYFNEFVVDVKYDGLESGLGEIKWHLVLAHFATFVLVFLCSFKGHVSAGKVVYVTATLPYVLLTVLLIRGVTLEGSLNGIIFFLKPDFSKLRDPNVWIEAAVQVFFQLGPACGSLITMSRYNKFHHPCHREAILIPVVNLLTALYGGLAIFSVLGFMAHRQGEDVGTVAKSGPALAYVVYPEGLAQLPFPPIWAAAFFLMLISVAIDTQFVFFETVVSGFTDKFPKLLRYKTLIAAILATFIFLIGLPLCFQGGIYLWQIMDWYGFPVTCIFLGFIESIIISYVYGLHRFRYDVSLMLKKPPNSVVSSIWFFATPLIMGAMTFLGLANLSTPTYKYTNYTYPVWAIAFGWMFGMLSFIPTPLGFLHAIVQAKGSLLKRLSRIFQTSDQWLPSKPELTESYRRRWQLKKKLNLYDFLFDSLIRSYYNDDKVLNGSGSVEELRVLAGDDDENEKVNTIV